MKKFGREAYNSPLKYMWLSLILHTCLVNKCLNVEAVLIFRCRGSALEISRNHFYQFSYHLKKPFSIDIFSHPYIIIQPLPAALEWTACSVLFTEFKLIFYFQFFLFGNIPFPHGRFEWSFRRIFSTLFIAICPTDLNQDRKYVQRDLHRLREHFSQNPWLKDIEFINQTV